MQQTTHNLKLEVTQKPRQRCLGWCKAPQVWLSGMCRYESQWQHTHSPAITRSLEAQNTYQCMTPNTKWQI